MTGDDFDPGFEEIPDKDELAAIRRKINGNAALAKDYTDIVPLHIDEWLARDLPPPDYLIGYWLTTTSRVILNAATGLGKANFGMAIAGHASAGVDFLHWHVSRKCRVLFVDGEMSRRLLQQRARDVVRRLPTKPEGLHLLSREDVPDFQPFNTEIGRLIINQFIDKIGGVDLVIFDNVMSLTSGGMKDEEVWQETLPLIKDLTRRCIGQLWIHHTGHDKSRGYGTSTREWQMDTVLQGNMVENPDTDVSFTLEFPKARERTPETRQDFENVTISLIDDQWISSAVKIAPTPASPTGAKFLQALHEVFASGKTVTFENRQTVKLEQWRVECERLGLVEKDGGKAAQRTFSKYKVELISRNYIACNDELVWIVRG
jgi:hypothetical protein